MIKAYQGDKEYFQINNSHIESIDILKSCGLLDLENDYDYNSITISLPTEAKQFAELLSSNHIFEDFEEQYNLNNYISAMMLVYGVIEVKCLHELLC